MTVVRPSSRANLSPPTEPDVRAAVEDRPKRSPESSFGLVAPQPLSLSGNEGQQHVPTREPAVSVVPLEPMTLEEAKTAGRALGGFLAGRFAEYRQQVAAGSPDDDALTQAFGPKLDPRQLPDTAALGIWSITGDFFYSVTTIDLASGNVFQTPPGNTLDPHGPLVPPPEARIVGTFSVEEHHVIETAIREGLRGASR